MFKNIESINSIETGKYLPSADNLTKIVQRFNIKFIDLFEFESLENNEVIFNDILWMFFL